MAQYILKRILGIILVLWVISMVTFALMHAVPGGPWDSGKWPIQGAAKVNLEKLYGLDKPIWQQYLIYMGNALRGDFGHPFSAPEETVFQVLARTGYDARAGAVNTPEAIRNLELAYLIGPIVFVAIGGACFLGYKLTAERHAVIRRELEARDAALADDQPFYDEAPIIESVTGEAAVPTPLVEPKRA